LNRICLRFIPFYYLCVILDITGINERVHFRKEFAYSSSDKMVYIRKFSTTGSRMTLVNTLQGHDAEVTCVKWNSISQKWITGSEDAMIRIWVC